jgi:hypothetical protein
MLSSTFMVRGLGMAALATIGLSASVARAAIPTGYKGTPYKGTPQAIPGRVELANLDVGGEGVAYHADHRRVNAKAEGYSPLSGDDYRVGELDLPDICRTNNFAPPDTWDNGMPYPTAAKEFWYYMGLAHSVDWVKVTVDVKVAGKYNVSTNFASAETQTGCSIWFNDGSAPAAAGDTHMDGVNKSGNLSFAGTGQYHTWRAYPNLAMVDLAAGVQVMTFHLRQNHLQYGFLVFDLMGGNPDGGAAGTGGGAGTGGAAGATGAGGSTSATDAGTVTGAAGTGGSTGVGTGAGGVGVDTESGLAGSSGAGAAGTGTGAAGTSGTITGAAGTTGAAGGPGVRMPSSGGCACGLGGRSGSGELAGLTLVSLALGAVIGRRRRRR